MSIWVMIFCIEVSKIRGAGGTPFLPLAPLVHNSKSLCRRDAADSLLSPRPRHLPGPRCHPPPATPQQPRLPAKRRTIADNAKEISDMKGQLNTMSQLLHSISDQMTGDPVLATRAREETDPPSTVIPPGQPCKRPCRGELNG